MEFNATFLISIISFIIFTVLMNKILYKPLETIVEEREKLISGNYFDAENAELKSKNLLEENADKLAKTKINARSIINTKIQDADNESSKIIEDAKLKNAEIVTEKKKNIQDEYEKIQNNMKSDTINIAQIISDKLLKEHIPIRSEPNE